MPPASFRAFTGSHRFVLDYLVEEVLQRQPERARSFLLQTAILDTLCGALCDAVTGQKHGKGMLERLERGNLFVVPLDDERQWYRYHHLFADVLQAHLLEEQPDQLPALHRRASEWYEENGSRSDAIRHALCAKDFEWAADLIERAGPMTEDSSQTATWLNWARALPDELIRSRPVLSVWYACALLGSGELEAAEARLTDAERWLEPGPSEPTVVVDQEQLRSLLATIAVARAYSAHSLGDVPGTVKHAQRVLELLPEGDHVRRGQATALMGMTYWASGDLEAADRVFVDYSQRLLAAGNIPDAISAMTVLPTSGRRWVVCVRRWTHSSGCCRSWWTRASLCLRMRPTCIGGWVSWTSNRATWLLPQQHLLRSKELGEQGELPVWRWRWCVAQARLNEAQGDLEGALGLLDEARALCSSGRLCRTSRPISALKARIWAAQGRVTEALEWARERGLSVDDDLSYLHEFEHITLARVLIARYESERVDGAVHDAARLLERLLHAAEEGGRIGSAIEILALQALAHQAQGDTSSALAPLERALSLAEPEGYVRVFVDEGPPMARLLQEAASRRVAPDSARRLLAAFPSTAKPPSTQGAPERARTRSAPADRRRTHEPGDRRPAVSLAVHGQGPCAQHLRQAGCPQPHAGRRQGERAGNPASPLRLVPPISPFDRCQLPPSAPMLVE